MEPGRAIDPGIPLEAKSSETPPHQDGEGQQKEGYHLLIISGYNQACLWDVFPSPQRVLVKGDNTNQSCVALEIFLNLNVYTHLGGTLPFSSGCNSVMSYQPPGIPDLLSYVSIVKIK